MSDLPTFLPLYLIPFRLMITQSLLVTVAIAIESIAIHFLLNYPPRKSIEYSISLNLFSLSLGWFFFLNVISNAPLPAIIEQDLINLILFDIWTTSTLAWSITAGLITFFGTFFIEVIGFFYLRQLRDEEEAIEEQIMQKQKPSKYPSSNYQGFFSFSNRGDADPLYAILIANGASYTAMIAILFFLRFGADFLPQVGI
ncbi:MAG: hypothetical protein F6K09_09245 [Merismopedia sp. SIO2A8]|nr:hypothetical protein [Merismopedia sp. SIO2A8]